MKVYGTKEGLAYSSEETQDDADVETERNGGALFTPPR